MKIMLDFKCDKCGTFERFADSTSQVTDCDCGATAHRQISTPTVKLDGTSGDFPGAHMKWAKIREDRARAHAKRNH